MVKADDVTWRGTGTFIKKDTMDAVQKILSRIGVKVPSILLVLHNKKQDGTG